MAVLAQAFSVYRKGSQEDAEVDERDHGDQGGEGRHFQVIKDSSLPKVELPN